MISLTLLVAVGVTVIIEFVRSLGPKGLREATCTPSSIAEVSILAQLERARLPNCLPQSSQAIGCELNQCGAHPRFECLSLMQGSEGANFDNAACVRIQ